MLWRAYVDEPVDGLTLSYLNMQTCAVAKAHVHVSEPSEFVRLVYVARGEATFTHATGTLAAREGEMLYWPANAPYSSVWSGEENQFAVIDMRVVDRGGAPIGFGDAPRILFRDVHRLYDGYVSDIEKLCAASQPFVWLERVSLALKLCCEIAREQLRSEKDSAALLGEGRLPDDAFSRIYTGIAYLEAHFTENVSTDELARMCSMSATSFRKLFFECEGMPPVDYRNSLRVRRAAELIKAGMSVGGAAEAVGIGDMKYFSKLFKRFIGVTPGKVRP